MVSWGTAQNGPIPKILGCDLCNTDVTQSPWVDNLSVYGLKFDYKFANGTLTGTTNQYNRKLNFNFDSTPILVSFGVPVPAESMEPQTRNLELQRTALRERLCRSGEFCRGRVSPV